MELMKQLVFLSLFVLASALVIDDHPNENSNSINSEITTLIPEIEVVQQEAKEDEIQGKLVINHALDSDEERPEVMEVNMIEKKIQRVEDPNVCYTVNIRDHCLDKVRNGSTCECEQLIDTSSIVCCNVTDIAKSISCLGSVTFKNIHIINVMQSEVNLGNLSVLKQIDSLAMTNGNITKVTGSFTKFTSIRCLSFADNKIVEIFDRAFSSVNVNQLRSLNLSGNNITRLPNVQNITVNVQGNSKISCINISTAIDRDVKFLKKENSYCERETIYHWFNDTASVNILALEKMKKLNEECPPGCKCEPSHMYYSSDTLEVTAKVDCSSLNLKKFPPELPIETVDLNVSNNSISSLSTLIDRGYYQNIRRLFIDDNQITSIEELAGTKFFENFTILSLKNNKIKEIPNYILSIFERNLNTGKVRVIFK
jgi:hypothetical protein